MNREDLLKVAKPILFNTDMVRAILDNKKTETRKVIKFPVNKYTKRRPIADNMGLHQRTVLPYTKKVCFKEKPSYCIEAKKPYLQGDIIYVRETWQYLHELDGNEQIIEGTGKYYYAATDLIPYDTYVDPEGITHQKTPWRPSIHMPKAAARIFLKVTDIRPERLQDIDGMGVLREGINSLAHPEVDYFDKNQREIFGYTWNSTIKKADQDRYGWEANPWVWVIKFKKLESEVEE